MVVQDEHFERRGLGGELLFDPAVPAAPDLAVVEVGLGRVDGDDGHARLPQDRAARAE